MTNDYNNQLPEMLTIKEVAKKGILSEYALRLLHKQGKLPCVELPRKTLINYTALLKQLQEIKGAL